MIKSRLAVCSESIVRDAETNNISVFNILEELASPEFPFFLPRFAAIFYLERDEHDPDVINASITITLNDKQIGHATGDNNFEGKTRTRLILAVQGLVIPEPGLLKAAVLVDDQELSSWSIIVQEAKANVA